MDSTRSRAARPRNHAEISSAWASPSFKILLNIFGQSCLKTRTDLFSNGCVVVDTVVDVVKSYEGLQRGCDGCNEIAINGS